MHIHSYLQDKDIEQLTKKKQENVTQRKQLKIKNDELFDKFEACARNRYNIYQNFIEIFKNTLDLLYTEIYDDTYARIFFNVVTNEEMELPCLPIELHIDFLPPNHSLAQAVQLSSSDLLMGAITMLFTFAACNRAPLVILDQSNFVLDKEMTEKLVNFILQKSLNMQIITATNNQRIYKKADTVIGISKDVSSIINY